VSVVEWLLKDPRVNITLADEYGRTALWHATFFGHLQVVEWLVASGKDLGDLHQKGNDGDGEYTPLEIATKMKRTGEVSLLERFLANPVLTRYQVRVELGLLDKLAAELFALIVFLCDNLLQLKSALAPTTSSNQAPAAVRFFTITSKLP